MAKTLETIGLGRLFLLFDKGIDMAGYFLWIGEMVNKLSGC
ncbi:MAG: hypothetical protein AAF960_20130 [Bacteroidota bacterium]